MKKRNNGFKNGDYNKNFNTKPGEKYKAIAYSKNKGESHNKKIIFGVYHDNLFCYYKKDEKTSKYELIKSTRNELKNENYSISILFEENPTCGNQSYEWDMRTPINLKIYYLNNNSKPIYYYLNDIKKLCEYHKMKVDINFNELENYKNINDLAIKIDISNVNKHDEINYDFIDKLIEIYCYSGLYEYEEKNRIKIDRIITLKNNNQIKKRNFGIKNIC